MVETIQIFNPNDIPFGPLSNNFPHDMEICEKSNWSKTSKDIPCVLPNGEMGIQTRWKSVTNYVYANMISSSGAYNLLKNIDPRTISSAYEEAYKENLNRIIKSSLEKGIDAKFSDESLLLRLLETGNNPIHYKSENDLLGIGDGDGENLYGKLLQQHRHRANVLHKRLKNDEKDKNRADEIYNAYVAKIVLETVINKEYRDISDFIGKSNIEIISTNPDIKNLPSRDTVIELYEYSKFHLDPETIIKDIRKRELRSLRRIIEVQIRREIYDLWLNYTISKKLLKKYPNISTKEIDIKKQKYIDTIDPTKLSEQIDWVIEQYELPNLSESLSSLMDKVRDKYTLPTQEEIEMAESEVINMEEIGADPQYFYEPVDGDPVIIDIVEGHDFSPRDYTGMLKIDNKLYPTVTHYVLANLLADVLGDLPRAIKIISKRPPNGPQDFHTIDTILTRYEQEKENKYAVDIKRLAVIGIDSKFTDRDLQDVLLLTDNAKLVWADREDSILGNGDNNKGSNFVGKYLMQKREEIRESRKGEKIHLVTHRDVRKIMQDKFMMSWVRMRVYDMCNTIELFSEYYAEKGISKSITPEFVARILDKIYLPCANLFSIGKEITIGPSPEFIELVKSCKGIGYEIINLRAEEQEIHRVKKLEITPEIIDILWKRVVVIIYYLTKYLEKTTITDIKKVIVNVELLVSKSAKCTQIVGDDRDNCILSALLNLLRSIEKINKKEAPNNKIGRKEVDMAASILIAQHIKKQKTKKQKDLDVERLGFAKEVFQDILEENDHDQIDGLSDEDSNLILAEIPHLFDAEEYEDIAAYIVSTVERIKSFKMPNKIKTNRVNFFATLK